MRIVGDFKAWLAELLEECLARFKASLAAALTRPDLLTRDSPHVRRPSPPPARLFVYRLAVLEMAKICLRLGSLVPAVRLNVAMQCLRKFLTSVLFFIESAIVK